MQSADTREGPEMPKQRATVLQIKRRQIVNRISQADTVRDKAIVRKELIAFDRKHGEAKTRTNRRLASPRW
jgi:hypothetical protein